MGVKRVICFDLWNTLVYSATGRKYDDVLSRLGIDKKDIYQFVSRCLMTRRLDYEQMIRELLEYFKIANGNGLGKTLQRVWQEDNNSSVLAPGARNILRFLKKSGFELVLVTNTTLPGWEEVDSRLHLAGEFDRLFLSCDQNLAKPDPKVWEIIQSWYPGVSKENFWMVGDGIDDITVPNELGWNTIQIHGRADLGKITALISKKSEKDIPREKILIVDFPIHADILDGLIDIGFTVVDFQKTARELTAWEGWRKLEPSRTLIVFPGKGAALVRSNIPEEWLSRWQCLNVDAKRYWEPGADPIAYSGRIFGQAMVLGVRNVVVVDDVISSGITCRKIFEVNQPWIPGSQWYALACVKQKSASLRGYIENFASRECGSKEKKSPINSLSTFISNPEMARAFARRNFTDGNGFLALLKKAVMKQESQYSFS